MGSNYTKRAGIRTIVDHYPLDMVNRKATEKAGNSVHIQQTAIKISFI
jgi:hypothetical protein